MDSKVIGHLFIGSLPGIAGCILNRSHGKGSDHIVPNRYQLLEQVISINLVIAKERFQLKSFWQQSIKHCRKFLETVWLNPNRHRQGNR
jgi:hypothetical protein